jgi:integrase/recombinase XerD
MIAWPDSDGAGIDRYVCQLRVRHPKTRRIYRGELRRFQRFIQEQGELTTASMTAWIRARSKQWPRHLVMDRACKVNRLLDFLVAEGTLLTQPFAELRLRYGGPPLSRIVQALSLAKSGDALEAARPLPAFGSFLGRFLREHVELRRSLGFRFDTQAGRFAHFDRFLQLRPDLKEKPVPILVREYESAAKTQEQRWACQLMARNLSRAWARIDPNVPPMKPDPRLKSRILAARRRPYIYTPQQIRQILDVARHFPSPRSPLRPLTLYTMVALAYCAGLRIGELMRLDLGDLCLEDGTITIRDTKFFKSRCLPLTDSAVSVVSEYVLARGEQGGSRAESAPLFWRQTRDGGGRYTRVTVEALMEQVLRRAGLKPARGRQGPRFHDIRHSFVNHRMTDWYRNGINPQAHLPYLATYLGHRDIYSTLAYMNATPELLQLASERFRTHVKSSTAASARSLP